MVDRNRGGVREGSGRPKLKEKEKRVLISNKPYLTQEAHARLVKERAKNPGMSFGDYLSGLILGDSSVRRKQAKYQK